MSSNSYPYILVILLLSYVVGQDNYKSRLTFVIDDTYSMYDDIEAIKIAVNAIFETVLHHNSLQIENFALVTFNDLITATIDPKTPTVIIDGVPKILAEYDKPLTLFCNVMGYPKANINWKNKGTGTTLTGELSLVEFPYKYLSVLTIEKVVKNATYECEGSNTSGSDSKTVEVEVHEPERRFIVKDTPKIIEVEYEKEVKMYCIVDAYPPAQITWYRLDGRKLISEGNIDISPDNSTLTFKYATIYDRGAYICEARNEDKKQQIIKHLKVLVGFESRYKTAYACEGETLKIGCAEGSFIHLFRANYGRFSMTTCNDHGNTGWSSNCMSTKSLRVLHNRCSMHNNCSTLASNAIFGDPCPNTLKYLEAHYECVPVPTTSTTTRPPPPWLITSQPSVLQSILPTISESPVQTQENELTVIPLPTPEKITTSQPDSSSKRSSPDIKKDTTMMIETAEIPKNEKPLKEGDFTAKIDPKTPTVIIDGDSKILAEYDKPLKLFCNVVGYPKANINWKNKGTGTTLTGEISLVEFPYEYLSVLTIENVVKNVTYECEGSNTSGSDRKTVEVEVHEPERRFIVKDTPKIIEVEYEKEVKMYCIVDAYPLAQITWYKLDGRKLISEGNIDISPDNTTLTFKYATIYDRGAYICEARNEDKKQQIIKHLKVLVGFESRYKTAYACEGETLKLGCPEGSFIHLIRANYGRFSMTTCNDHGNTGWSSNCMSTKSLRVLHNRCSMHNNCSTLASNTIFGDPCPNTLKYLEAHYECVPVSTTSTTTTLPPTWLITSQPSVERSTLPSIFESPVQTQKNESTVITPPTPEKITTSQPDSSSKRSSPDIKEDTAMIIETAEIPPNEMPLKKEDFTAKIDPKTPTVIIDGDSKILAEYDKPLKLFCNVIGYPKANINWKNKCTGTTLIGEMSLAELPYKYLSVLTIQKVDTNATYECEGSNTSGSDRKSVEVEVHEPERRFIVKDTPKILEVEYEKEVKMYCIVDAYPPAQITWYRLDGRKLFSKGNIDISPDNTTLTFKYATIYDRGAYICEARNEDKKQQIIKHLKVLVGFESRYKTAYACEGETLKIGCPEGSFIHLVRANYGRFSMTTCNDHGNTGWSSNCMSTKSLRVLHNRCSMHNNCSTLASNTIFGDPCPNTLKYLEAHYECVPESRYKTAYVCEGNTLKIGCAEGSFIHLLRANYGRFSMTTCNDHGNTGWSSNCMSTSSLGVLHNRCSMHNNCSTLASNTIFGDPCPNTLKYLEAHYECVPESRYKTAYACEGNTLKIGCAEGSFIHLLRANYGRFSMTTCNDHGNTGWSSNCMSTSSLGVLHNRCSMHNNCSIVASNTIFGDPCPNTLKYLEAHYECVPVSTTSTTTRSSPPWLITSQPSVWRSTLPSVSESPVQTQRNESTVITPPTFRPHITLPLKKTTTRQPTLSSERSIPNIKEDIPMNIETSKIPKNDKQ